MSLKTWNATTTVSILAGILILVASGCGQPAGELDSPAATPTSTSADDHSGWWCVEHGVPEAVCAQCNTRLAADFQKKGDWCAAHRRPESQCFICHPELEAKFAAQYEAKYGRQPPQPDGEGDEQDRDASG